MDHVSMGAGYHSRRYSKKSAATNDKIQYKKPTAKNQQKQILALNKKVNDNTRKLAGVRYKVVHKTRLALNIIGTPGAPYRILQLNAPSLMTQIFSAPNENEGGKYNWDSKGRTHVEFNIVSNNEPDPLPLQVFIFSAKNTKVAAEIGLQSSPLVVNLQSDRDYVTNIGASTFMNMKRFNIHRHWNINLAPVKTLGGTTPWQGDLHPIHRQFSMRNPMRLNNRTGVWSGTPDNSVNPNQRLFMVVFNNNVSQPDTYPILSGLSVNTAYTSE